MNLNIGAEYEAFRDEVQRFLAANWQAGAQADAQAVRAFRRRAIAGGAAVPSHSRGVWRRRRRL